MPKRKKRKVKKKKKNSEGLLTKDIAFSKKFYFDAIESIYLIVDSGQDILTAIEASTEDADDKRLKRRLGLIEHDLKHGSKFWQSLETHELIPQRFVNIIKVGEENGILHETLNIVIQQYQHEKELKSKIQAASIYPIILLSLTVVIGLGISWFILPQLTSLYDSFGTEIPFTTKMLLGFGNFVRSNGYWFVPAMIIATITFITLYKKNAKMRLFGERLQLRLPGFRQILLEAEMSRMGNILGSLLQVGIPFDIALDSLIDATPVFTYKNLYKDFYGGIMQGLSFSKFFSMTKPSKRILPSSVRHLIIAGEQSGNLSKVFLQLGVSFNKRITKTAENLTKILEPMLLIVIFVFVAILAMGIIQPIYSQLGNLNF
jgi:type II secretory pathway component PulF